MIIDICDLCQSVHGHTTTTYEYLKLRLTSTLFLLLRVPYPTTIASTRTYLDTGHAWRPARREHKDIYYVDKPGTAGRYSRYLVVGTLPTTYQGGLGYLYYTAGIIRVSYRHIYVRRPSCTYAHVFF